MQNLIKSIELKIDLSCAHAKEYYSYCAIRCHFHIEESIYNNCVCVDIDTHLYLYISYVADAYRLFVFGFACILDDDTSGLHCTHTLYANGFVIMRYENDLI